VLLAWAGFAGPTNWIGVARDHVAAAHDVGRQLGKATGIAEAEKTATKSALAQSNEIAEEEDEIGTPRSSSARRRPSPLVSVAECKSWTDAFATAREFLSADDVAAAEKAGILAEAWPERQRIAREFARAKTVGKLDRQIWRLLGAQTTDGRDLAAVTGCIVEEGGYGTTAYHRWIRLQSDAELECEPFDREDPFASAFRAHARRVAADLAETKLSDAAAPTAPELAKTAHDLPSGAPGDAVIVVPEVGGGPGLSSTREVERAFRDIINKPLRLTPVPKDLSALRATLLAEYPHAALAVNTLLGDLRLGKFVQFKNSVIAGPPGVGKSRIVRRICELLSVPTARYDGASSLDNMFGGVTRSWSSSMPCFPITAMIARSRKANGVILVDELDKCSIRNQNGNLAYALLPLTEQENAKRFPDPYFLCEIDLSHVTFFATVNELEKMPAPLRDRFRVLQISEPRPEHMTALARTIVRDLGAESGEDPRFYPELEDGELLIAESLWPRGGSIRRLRRIVEAILRHREMSPRQ
jgi:hypothetical protein